MKQTTTKRLARVASPKQAKNDKAKKIVMTSLAVGAAGVLGYFGWQYYQANAKKKDGDLDEALLRNGDGAGSGSNTTTTTTATPPFVDNTAYTPPPSYNPPPPAASWPPIDYSDPTPSGSQPSGGSAGASAAGSWAAQQGAAAIAAAKSGNGFPLRRGSKGDRVRTLQQALIKRYGKGALPRYGADGSFGSEMVAALKKYGLPDAITESTYNVIVKGGGTKSPQWPDVAKKLHAAAVKKDLNGVLTLLQQIGNKDEYSSTSTAFQAYRIGSVRQTLVNGLLTSFPADAQKQRIRYEFLRMGLKYNGNKWSLSGLIGRTVMTKVPSTVWVNARQSLPVPAKMVLGTEVSRRLDYTLFENNSKYFLVRSDAVQYLS